MQSPPFPRYLVPPRSKYSPQHHVLKHTQLPFLQQFQRPSFTPTQNNRQNYIIIMIIYRETKFSDLCLSMSTEDITAVWVLGINICEYANMEASISVPDVCHPGVDMVKIIAASFIAPYSSISFSRYAKPSRKAYRISVSHITQTMTKMGRLRCPS